MKRNLYLIFFCIVYCPSLLSQDKTYVQQSIIGLHVVADKFQPAGEDNPVRIGIALNYLKGFTPRTDIDITMSGSYLSYPFQKALDANKHLLLELDASVREKLFPGQHRFNPFLKAGLGVSQIGRASCRERV